MRIRKFVVTCEDIREENGREVGRLVRRAVCSAVIANPLAGKPGADLAELEAMGAEISGQLADRALAAKTSAEYKHARTKAAESEMAYRKAFDETLAKQDPEAASIQKKQRDAFREKMLKARTEKKASTGKPAAANPDAATDSDPERNER